MQDFPENEPETDEDDDESVEDSMDEIDEENEAEVVGELDAIDALPVSAKLSTLNQKSSRARGGSIAKKDPLQAYMQDVSRFPLLSREEAHDLAVRYKETGDVDAAARLVTANLRLVVKIAYGYRRAYKNILDLVQEGNMGLMQAVKKYDPYKGVKLSTYAAFWIRAYILRFILNNHRLVKLGTTQAQRKLYFNLKKEKAKLSAMGIEPTAELIAERLTTDKTLITKKDVTQMEMRLSAGDASLDAPVGQADGRATARVELMPSPNQRQDDVLADQQVNRLMIDKIHEYGRTLDGKEAVIFQQRLVAEDPQTLQELGDGFGVSRERVRQIEKRLQGKLKKFLERELGDAVLG